MKKIGVMMVMALGFVTAACSEFGTAGGPNSPTAVMGAQAATGGNNTCVLANGNTVATGFDALGYNRCAGIFNGVADGVDGVLDGKLWGSTAYAMDRVKMKWNAAWDVCNFARNAENCAGAWTDNQWNGMAPGGSGETWHYKMSWVGACGAAGTPLAGGGYCIWNEYAVSFSHGTSANEHFWDTHARPNGYGSF